MSVPAPAVLPAGDPAGWRGHLLARIDPAWRPGEYRHDELMLVPDPDNPHTWTGRCTRDGCPNLLDRRGRYLCGTCRQAHRASGMPVEKFARTARHVSLVVRRQCAVGCDRRASGVSGLCVTHDRAYRKFGTRHGQVPVAQWVHTVRPSVLAAIPECVVSGCGWAKREGGGGLCRIHRRTFEVWRRAREGEAPRQPSTVELWLHRVFEPPDALTGASLASLGATPFGLLEGTAGLELLLGVQVRDKEGRAHLAPFNVRWMYSKLRAAGTTTLVGLTEVLMPARPGANMRTEAADLLRLVNEEHRRWSGADVPDSRVIHLRDCDLNASSHPIGPNDVLDLRGIQQPWIAESLEHFVWRGPARGEDRLRRTVAVWRLADEVLSAMNPARAPHELGSTDIDAIVRAVRRRWENPQTQRRCLASLWMLIDHCRQSEDLAGIWRHVPARFARSDVRHQAEGPTGGPDDTNEHLRFEPQPILHWIMDRLDHLEPHTENKTMEARVMVFLQERCGRRPTETLQLVEDCISYDHVGDPYLEWTCIKPHGRPGARLPLHQATHDVIRQWQKFKRDRGVRSRWLFPSPHFSAQDRPYRSDYLNARVKDLLAAVMATDPYPGGVEGANGNLIHFDMSTIDAYALRHAFAQRYVDALDEHGRHTTSPDVLQNLMGHKSFTTTMAYFEVTSRRRKQALASVPPRRLTRLGQPVEVNHDRDSFTKVAVSIGHCTEPQNVALGGTGCALDHACETCHFLRVDPLERDAVAARRGDLKVQLERAAVIGAAPFMLDNYRARIASCEVILDGIDTYVAGLPLHERTTIEEALTRMADIRRRATSPRRINLQDWIRTGRTDA